MSLEMNRSAALRSGPSQWKNVNSVFTVRFSHTHQTLAVGVDLIDHGQVSMAPAPGHLVDPKRLESPAGPSRSHGIGSLNMRRAERSDQAAHGISHQEQVKPGDRIVRRAAVCGGRRK